MSLSAEAPVCLRIRCDEGEGHACMIYMNLVGFSLLSLHPSSPPFLLPSLKQAGMPHLCASLKCHPSWWKTGEAAIDSLSWRGRQVKQETNMEQKDAGHQAVD